MNKDYYHLLKCQYIDFKQLGPTFILIIKSKDIKLKSYATDMQNINDMGPLLLIWINFNHSMDKLLHPL